MADTSETLRRTREASPWNRMARGYDNNVLSTFETAYTLSIEKVCAHLAPQKQVLEIGCGTGIVTLGIAPHAGRVVGVDISPEMIAVAREKAARLPGVGNLEFQVFDGYQLPFPGNSFDLVLLFNVLHMVKDPRRLLGEAHRLLAPQGWLLTATDCYAEAVPLKLRLILTAQLLLKAAGVVPYLRYYRRENLRRLFAQTGFSTLEAGDLHPAPVNHYLAGQKIQAS